MEKQDFIKVVKFVIESKKQRSAWDKGVNSYCFELLENLENSSIYTDCEKVNFATFEKVVLNGAPSWGEYSWGGCSFIYNSDIAEALCSPSELKRSCNGRRNPNSREQWLDVQARALYQACNRLYRACLQVWNGDYQVVNGYFAITKAPKNISVKIAK